ncbi:MAG: acyl-CoA dehydrogenase [Micropruina sp.]|nr:acyl-CoA dehydrogenase family protein [Micropruina sp.]
MTITHDTEAAQAIPTHAESLGEALLEALDGPYHAVRSAGRAAFPTEGMLRDPAMGMAEAREWTLHRLGTLVEAGFGQSIVPSATATPEQLIQSLIDFEVVSYGDLSVAIKSGVQHGLFGGAIASLGSPAQHDRFLADALSLRLLGCFAMTEVGHGSDVQSLETTITYDRLTAEFVIDSPTPAATKTYLGNAAAHGRMAAVFGQLIVAGQRHGIHCILVPIRDDEGRALPGVTLGDNGHKGGLLGVDNGTITFDQVRVARDLLLDRFGRVNPEGSYESPIDNANRRFFTMLGALVRGRICIGAGAAIASRRALAIAVTYAEKRRQFRHPGRKTEIPLLDYQAHQRKLLPAIAKAYALGFAQNDLISAFVDVVGNPEHEPRAQRELESLAAGLKVLNTRFANDTVQVCREACGGAGYMSENQLTQLRADTDVFATFEGDNTVLSQLVTKGILTNYREVWGGLDGFGLVQASARLVTSAVIERTGAGVLVERLVARTKRRAGEATFFDRGWHAWMFEERERHVVDGLARRFRAADKDSFEAMNRLQGHVVFAARVHMDRVVLDSFIEGIEACPASEVKDVLERLCTLYALISLEQDSGWFQEHQRLSASRARALRGQVDVLCLELRGHAGDLVQGLGIKREWLGAAMLDD